ncbi:hypothetical protein [Microbulbifer hydrolyticus]|nr:hypothetical protein [Microbulbifer hydrolyticus]
MRLRERKFVTDMGGWYFQCLTATQYLVEKALLLPQPDKIEGQY